MAEPDGERSDGCGQLREEDGGLTFFIDHNLGKQLAEGLRGFGENVVHLTEKFPQDARDEDWLPYLGMNNLLLVTRDLRVLKNPLEKNSLKHHKVGAFFLGGKSLSRCQLIQQIVRNWPRIKELARKTNRPFAFIVPPKGKIKPFPL